MEISIFCPRTQTVVAVWILADHGSFVDDCRKRAGALEVVADEAVRRYCARVRASGREPDVRNS